MTALVALLRRELQVALFSPVTWLVTALVVLGLEAAFFFLGYPMADMHLPGLWEGGGASLDALFAWIPLGLCILAPAICMASWAEERRSGSDEFLLTQPLSVGQLVLAKFLSAWLQLSALVTIAIVPVAVMVAGLGNLDVGTALGGLLGAWLLAAPCAAIGCLSSALSSDQLAAFLVAAVALVALWSVALFVRVLPGGIAAVAWTSSPQLAYLETGARGILDARAFLQQGLMTCAALLLNVVIVEGWRWR